MPDPAVQLIRDHMAVIRARAPGKAYRLGEETRQFFDWKHYVRRFPWATLAVAGVVGYLLVPRKVQVTLQDAEAIAELARKNQLVMAPVAETRRSPGMLASIVSLGTNMLVRGAMAYAAQQMGKLLAGGADDSHPSPETSTREHFYDRL